jgi:hypothetical protein
VDGLPGGRLVVVEEVEVEVGVVLGHRALAAEFGPL